MENDDEMSSDIIPMELSININKKFLIVFNIQFGR